MSEKINKDKLLGKSYWEDVFLKGQKECSRCKEILPVIMFSEQPLSKRGYRYLYSHCKICDKKRTAVFKTKKS